MKNSRRTRKPSSKITQETLKRIVRKEVKTIQEGKRIKTGTTRNTRSQAKSLNETKTVANGQRFFRRYLSLLAEAFVNNGYSEAEAKRRAVAYTKKWMPGTKARKPTRTKR